MEILARYIHGSEDSTDVDVVYVVDELPDKAECKRFCSEDPNENRNLITIKDGAVSEVYKGTIDEVNNALLSTYGLHEQSYPLLVKRHIERIPPLKYVRGVRIILSHLSRSQYRERVKKALRSNWRDRLNELLDIDITTIDFSALNKHMDREDILKVIAFQCAQMRGFIQADAMMREPAEQKEIYTKHQAAEVYPELEPFLYRDPGSDIAVLKKFLDDVIYDLRWHIRSWDNDKDKENLITFIEYGYRDYFINMNTEQIVEVKEYENCTGVRNKEWLAFDRVIIDLMNSEKFMHKNLICGNCHPGVMTSKDGKEKYYAFYIGSSNVVYDDGWDEKMRDDNEELQKFRKANNISDDLAMGLSNLSDFLSESVMPRITLDDVAELNEKLKAAGAEKVYFQPRLHYVSARRCTMSFDDSILILIKPKSDYYLH
jgi:hypothetical protein